MSDIDTQGIADRLYGGTSAPAPATPAATETSAAASEPVAKPAATSSDAAEAARAAQLARGAAISARAAADKAETERAKTPIEDRVWAKADAAPALAEVPESVKALRDTPERRMFSAQGSFSTVQVQGEVSPEVASAASTELREIFADVGASGNDAAEFLSLAAQMTAAPATPEARAELRASAIDAVNRQYGNDAKSAVDDARALVARDPRVAAMLASTGLGDHPQAVLKIIELARSAKMRGQL
jgi:hypothetical protein